MQALSATQNLFGNEYLEAYVRNDGRFTMGTRQGNPNISTDDNKILLFGHPEPWSSFTTIKINGINYTFDADGPPTVNAEGTEAVSVMTKDGVTVKQIITLMNNPSTNRKDVFRIEYQMTNNSGTTCSIGARIMLDTMLGSNDGAPFKVPGIGDVTTEIELVGDDIPQSWQSFDNLLNPTVVSNGIFYRNTSEKPDKVQFCDWKGIRSTSWDYTVTSGRSLTGDSAVGIYFNPKTYLAGQTRTVRTYYGIGDFAQSDLNPPLSMRVIAPSEMEVDAINGDYMSNPFRINVHIQNTGNVTAKNVKVSISLPPQLTLDSGSSNVTLGDFAVGADRQVSFLVRAALQNTDKTVNYSIKLSADNDPGKTMNLSLFLPKVSGAQKLPVIFIPGIFGSTMKNGRDNAGPIRQLVPNLPKQMPANQDDLKVYDNYAVLPGDTAYSDIVKELNKMGYKAYTCPYDWRLSLQSIVENKYLQNIIDKAKRESGQDKVILIAHSMGGLVARQYIQSSLYRNDVDTLIMIGTPNNGSAFTYPILEGGEIVDKSNKKVDPIEYNTTGDVTANIVVSAYSTMVSRVEKLTSKQLFDFLYTNKRIPAVIGLGAQYDRLLYWVSNSTYSNPLIDKAGFESEIAKLNSMS
jgi:pimeloyl-ACP methyl ester carboxylesterase